MVVAVKAGDGGGPAGAGVGHGVPRPAVAHPVLHVVVGDRRARCWPGPSSSRPACRSSVPTVRTLGRAGRRRRLVHVGQGDGHGDVGGVGGGVGAVGDAHRHRVAGLGLEVVGDPGLRPDLPAGRDDGERPDASVPPRLYRSVSPVSTSVAATGAPTLTPEPGFSAMLRAAGAVSVNTGALLAAADREHLREGVVAIAPHEFGTKDSHSREGITRTVEPSELDAALAERICAVGRPVRLAAGPVQAPEAGGGTTGSGPWSWTSSSQVPS